MPENNAKDFREDVFPAELEQILDRRNVSLPGDRDGLGKTVQAFRTARDLKTAIDTASSQRTVLLRLKAKVLSAVENLSQRIPVRQLQRRFTSVARDREIEAEIKGYERALEKLTQDFQLTEKTKPSTLFNLVGLAFSGGGIRSATFNLGILQSLADLGLLKFFDYLSTVSGGGYIGSWLTAWSKRQQGGIIAVAEQIKPARQAQQANARNPEEPRPIFHLRRYSNYLTPRLGLFSQDTWTGVATYIRNLLLNQLILIPALGFVLVIPRILSKLFCQDASLVRCGHNASALSLWIGLSVLAVTSGLTLLSIASALNRFRQAETRHFRLRDLHWGICVPLLAAAFVFSWLVETQRSALQTLQPLRSLLQLALGQYAYAWLYWFLFIAIVNLIIHVICAVRRRTKNHLKQYFLGAFISGGIAGLLLYLLVHFGLDSWISWQWGVVTWATLGPPSALIIFLLAVTLQVGVVGITEPDAWREWRASMGAWVLIYALVWTGIFAISFYGPLGWHLLVNWTTTKATLISGWLASTVAAVLAGKSSKTDGSRGPAWIKWLTTITPVIAVAGLLIAVALFVHTVIDGWSTINKHPLSAILPPAISAPHKNLQGKVVGTAKLSDGITVNVNLKLEEASETKQAIVHNYWAQVQQADEVKLGLFLLLCGVIAGGLARTVDINEFSLHAAYRNRLVRCYLGASRIDVRKPDPITDFDPNDDFELANLSTSQGYNGPYPLINTALNLTAGKELAWQERKAFSFILTPRFCGSQVTQYRDTKQFAGGINLGTALAVSGAAASPNMGYHTSAPMAFLMTLFNVRLGRWVGNPAQQRTWDKSGPQWSLFYLLTELFGQTDAKSRYVYLSDGGHFENLGIYELIRRRCKYIVCCDAGADPQIGFEDLGKAIRQIRTDQGVDIEIDLDMVRPQAGQRHSRWHHAIGIIRYDQADPGESVGMLIYIKASITEDESGDVLEYAGHHSSFPHQSTADQFFDESQFESYRKLGEHIAWEVFRCAQTEATHAQASGNADEIFNALRHHWVSVPISIRDSFLGQKEALIKLEAKLRDDPQLARYDAEIYPELEAFLGANPTAWPALDPRAALHFCAMQIQLMENVFIALEFQKYHSYALNRGWMNLFRRWAVAPTFQKLWPGLRGSYSRRFVDFVEEQLIPCEPFTIVAGISSGLTTRLVDEFRRDQLSAEISPQFPNALTNPLTLQTGVCATWFAVPATAPPGKGVWDVDEAWGAAVITKGPPDYDYQLFVWVRGAYRNLGVGGTLLDTTIAALRNSRVAGKILVDLGEEKPGSASYQERKGAWLRFYGQRGFIREHKGARLRLTLQL